MTTPTPTPTPDLIINAARACAQGWAEQAREASARRWTESVPDADHDYLEREILGRSATDEESAEFSRVFVEEYDACLAQKAEREGWEPEADVEEPGWFADDGNAVIHFPEATSAAEAARDYVDGGDWGDSNKTMWIRVKCWRSVGGERVDEETITIALDPDEPACSAEDHDWSSPHEVVGGLAENPGVRGNGGGVIITEVCAHCGSYRITNTWAQNSETGEQGLTAVEYADSDEDSEAWLAAQGSKEGEVL